MKKKAIVFDCDDILLEYNKGIKAFVEKYYNITPNGLPTDYNLKEWFGVSGNKTVKIITHFNQDSYEFGLLEPLDDAVTVLKKLHEMFGDVIDFFVLTKSGTLGHGEVLRKVNLINVFGDIFKDIIIIGQNETKTGTILKLQEEYDILCFVDDYVNNIDDAEACGVTSVLIERSHNIKYKEETNYTFLNNWNTLLDYLLTVISNKMN